jgi:Na+-transporting NADH:ubiquinone oxidoreductase subunit A
MALHKIRRGLDIPIAGRPEQHIHPGPPIGSVAVVADVFPGLKPRLHVQPGDEVVVGQTLFEDRSIPGVRHTSPGAGRVAAVNRGSRRVLQSVIIDTEPGDEPHATYQSWNGAATDPGEDAIRALLVESGQWTALRARPFGRVPAPDSKPAALFVTAMDTAPLAPDPAVIVAERHDDFVHGLRILATLTDGTTHVCVAPGSTIAQGLDAPVTVEEFAGPHPAGTAGVHIHLVAPASRRRTVWHVGYQDVIAVGHLFRTGRLDVERVVAIGGPPVTTPRLVRTRLGAELDDLLAQDKLPMAVRVISGSPLDGRSAAKEAFSYLGRYDQQVSVLREGRKREFLGWIMPGAKRFSIFPAFLSSLLPRRPLAMTTSTNGSRRPIIPNGQYERVMAMDLVPSYLLRALAVGDIERAEELGCLELIEEDLALCTFVDPGKNDFGPMLRKNLDLIEKDG